MKSRPDRREVRRLGAKKRFKIIPRSSMVPVPNADDYDKYLDRKVTEAKALGLVPKKISVKVALNILGEALA